MIRTLTMPEHQKLGGAEAPRPEAKADKGKALEAARQFESLLLKHVLSSLEKTASLGGPKKSSSSTYQSMAVDALADGLSKAGGLGLADLVAKMLEGEMGGAKR